MSKAWDLSCVCDNCGTCKYCREVAAATPKPRGKPKMSADWLYDNETSDKLGGYHLRTFDRGVYGESSKILEEVRELQDAEDQGARVMALHELSDILGAVYGYLAKHYPDLTFDDLVKMMTITRRAFENGHRK